MNGPRPLFLAGPTAVGKSAVALELADCLGGEIISVDSMQVYRGLNIGTAKPSQDELRRVQHHLVDIIDLHEPFSAAAFVQLAKAACEDILNRGKVPILAGGTGLYFKTYLYGVGEAPPGNAELRKELETIPLEGLLEELKRIDPETYERIDRQNGRRVIRAVEVTRLTGLPYSAQRSVWQRSESAQEPLFFGLARSVEDLRQRIDQRVDAMFEAGLVSETKQLLEQGLESNPVAMQAIGYRQVVEHLRGERSLAETIALVKQKTRQFAKRQMTWFRHQLPVRWIPVTPEDRPSLIAARIVSASKEARLQTDRAE